MKKPQQIRQGDVLLVEVDSIPTGATGEARTNGEAILAFGEKTGHAHVLDAPNNQVIYRMTAEGQKFVNLVKDTALRHEEHAAIFVVAGKYAQAFQVEDYGAEIRKVAD